MPLESDVSRARGVAGVYAKRDFDLLVCGIGLLGVGNRGTIELVVFHQSPDIGERCLNFLNRERLAHLQLRGVYDLRFCGASGSAFNTDLPYKKNRCAGKYKYNASAGRRFAFGAEVGKASGGKQDTQALPELLPIERFPLVYGNQSAQYFLVRLVNPRKFNFFDL